MKQSLKAKPKLKVGKVGDKYEKEADRVSNSIMSSSSSHTNGQYTEETISRKPNGEGRPLVNSNIEKGINNTQGKGMALPSESLNFMESRFGANFRNVRIHSDNHSATMNRDLNSRAFTIGRDIYFNKGYYNPSQPTGKKLLAHELTHVVQQGGAKVRDGQNSSIALSSLDSTQIQGSFFGDLWEGIKSVGMAIGNAVTSALEWVGERMHDAAMWVVNLLRDLPKRLLRLGQTILEGLQGIISFIPEAINALAKGGIKGFGDWLWEKAKAGGFWVLRLVSRVFDVLGGPEAFEFVTHILTKASPLSSDEKNMAKSVFGPNAIRWNDVRIAEGGLLTIVFAINKNRSFVTFHTINMHDRTKRKVLIHELTHVYQYEKVGSLYLGQAIMGQIETPNYDYGGTKGLINATNSGKHFRDFNREQQAKIVEDYYDAKVNGLVTTAYDPFIAELRAGDI